MHARPRKRVTAKPTYHRLISRRHRTQLAKDGTDANADDAESSSDTSKRRNHTDKNNMTTVKRFIRLDGAPPKEKHFNPKVNKVHGREAEERRRIFEQAFSGGVGHSVMECACGKTYYNPCGGWDWSEGELEELDQSPSAISVPWTVGEVVFDGKTYAADCECWHKHADRCMNWMDNYRSEIAAYLNTIKAEKLTEARSMPSVDED